MVVITTHAKPRKESIVMPHKVDVHVGKKLKQLRNERRLSQTDVAKKLGLSFQQVQKYEIGSNRISASRLFELSQILEVKPNDFFYGLPGFKKEPAPVAIGADYSLLTQ